MSKYFFYVMFFMTLISLGLAVNAQKTTSEIDLETRLMAFLDIRSGSTYYNGAGESFKIFVTVKNVGENDAENARFSLEDIPSGWNVDLLEGQEQKKILAPGDFFEAVYNITRDEVDSTIYVIATADNAPPVSSDIIPIPINPLVLVIFSVVALTIFIFRKKVN